MLPRRVLTCLGVPTLTISLSPLRPPGTSCSTQGIELNSIAFLHALTAAFCRSPTPLPEARLSDACWQPDLTAAHSQWHPAGQQQVSQLAITGICSSGSGSTCLPVLITTCSALYKEDLQSG